MNRALLAILLLLSGCLEDKVDGYQGYLDGEYLYIAAPEAGRLASVAVTKGGHVAAGAPLFALDPTQEQAALDGARSRLAQAEHDLADLLTGARPEEIAAIEAQLADASANAQLANLTLARETRLLSSHVVSQAQVDSARAAAESAAAQVARIKWQLQTAKLPGREEHVRAARAAADAARHAVEQAVWARAQRDIASPVEADIDDVVRRPGEWVPPNGIVVALLPPSAIKAVFFVPEPHRAEFHPGDTVKLSCTGCAPGLTARIGRIANAAEYTPPVIYSRDTKAKLVFRMEAMLPLSPNMPRPGQPVTVRP